MSASAADPFAKFPCARFGATDLMPRREMLLCYLGHLQWQNEGRPFVTTQADLARALCVTDRYVRTLLRLLERQERITTRSTGRGMAVAVTSNQSSRPEQEFRSDRNRSSAQTGTGVPVCRHAPLRADSDQTTAEQTAGSTPTESMPESGRKGGEAASACSSKEAERPCPDKGAPRRATGVYERLQQLAVNKTQAWAMADKRDLGWVERQVREFAARRAKGFRKGLPAFLWLRHLWDEDSEGAAPKIPRVRPPEPNLARPGASPDPEHPPSPPSPEEAARRATEEALMAEALQKFATWKSEAGAGGSRRPLQASPEYREKMQQAKAALRARAEGTP